MASPDPSSMSCVTASHQAAARQPVRLTSALALSALALASSGCPAQAINYKPLNPQIYSGNKADDRQCVHTVDQDAWQPGQLTPHLCSPWTDRSELDVVVTEWIFFPHLLTDSTTRARHGCTQCRLEVKRQKADADAQPARWTLRLLAPEPAAELARYEGQLRAGMFHGQGSLTLRRTERCRGYCKDFFVADRRLVDTISLTGTWAAGALVPEVPFLSAYASQETQERYQGQAVYDAARGVVPHGDGELTRQELAVYRGQWKMGKRHGQGQEQRPDGTRYVGQFHEDQWQGQGTLTEPNSDWYEGAFAEGLRHGRGSQRLAQGQRYDGEFARGLRHGQGTLLEVDGQRYDGQFARGLRHGQGEHHSPEGARYRGQWREDMRHGLGQLRTAEGLTIEGRWAADALQQDDLKLSWPEGQPTRAYQGAAQELLPHGVGQMTWADGVTYAGAFKHGRLSGLGLMRWPDGSVHMGGWAEGKPEGCGLRRDPEGKTFVGTWSRGALLSADCDASPQVLTPEALSSLGKTELERSTLQRAWSAQRASRASREAAAARVADLAPLYAAAAAPKPAEGAWRELRLSLSPPPSTSQRMAHPRCFDEQTVSLKANDAPVSGRWGGLVDAEVSLWLPAGKTTELCATLDGPCGQAAGCLPIDVPSEEETEPLRRRLPLSSPPTPAERSSR